MRIVSYRNLIAGTIALFLAASVSYAAETPVGKTNLTITTEPASYAFVKGDSSKFRALHWMDDDYAFGVKDFTSSTQLQDDVTLEAEGHGVPEDGDYSGLMTLQKEDYGYLRFDYDEFRKYYSNAGGYYQPFTNDLNSNYTDKELALNIGKFGFEGGLRMKNIPEITLDYEREFKNGTKSRLTWAYVKDAASGASKKIAPSWQEIDEVVDSFDAKAADTFYGFDWKGQQHWEFVRSKNLRHEQLLANTPTASDYAIVDQYTEPRADVIASTFNVGKWFWKDKAYGSGGYRYSQINSRELESIYTENGNGVPQQFFSYSEQVRNAYSDTMLTSQTGVASFMTTLFSPLTAITRFKAEAVHVRGESTYLKDNKVGFPDGSIDDIDVANNQQKLMNYGESVSLRYNGIARTAIYNEYEFQQTRNNLYDNFTSGPATEFHYQDISHQFRGSETLGAQFVPWDKVTMTIQGKYRQDDLRYNHALISGSPTILIDSQVVATNEAETRLAWKPARWFQPSFRYQLMDKKYQTVTQKFNDDAVETAQEMSVYTWDVTSQPIDSLLLTASFSYTDGKVITPVRYSDTAAAIPTYNFDSYATVFSAEYELTKTVSLTSVMDYIRASNFNDFSAIGMPYGADFTQTDVTVGCRWKVKEDLTLEPKYAYYEYRDGGSDVGHFSANVIWLEAKINWG
ncbi:MAG: hypothetical protein AUJ72_05715 [Candidatus Omnitrophica bacterium CG1_02_46_14]|nr:MAG: hypothetical protein AUJ72_05715 [Candidatus Omnitrophica bacterium CG1_02_46_14]